MYKYVERGHQRGMEETKAMESYFQYIYFWHVTPSITLMEYQIPIANQYNKNYLVYKNTIKFKLNKTSLQIIHVTPSIGYIQRGVKIKNKSKCFGFLEVVCQGRVV